jgi:hypothetical protein
MILAPDPGHGTGAASSGSLCVVFTVIMLTPGAAVATQLRAVE